MPSDRAGAFEVPTPVGRAVELAQERKAGDVMVLDLRGLLSATDFFVIASGRSDIQVRAIGEHIVGELKGEGVGLSHVEGMERGRWVLLDYGDFVVHVFHPEARTFYQLERLWGDAPRMDFGDGEAAPEEGAATMEDAGVDGEA